MKGVKDMDHSKASSVAPEDESVSRREADVEEQRQRFVNSVTLLRDRVEETVEDISDWRSWVSRMPWTAVASCVVAGWAVGRLTSRR